jgi:hypothetical protein
MRKNWEKIGKKLGKNWEKIGKKLGKKWEKFEKKQLGNKNRKK